MVEKNSESLPWIPPDEGHELVLRFILPREEYEAECALNGHKWRRVVCEVLGLIRQELKYNNALSEKEKEVYMKIREGITTGLGDRGLPLE